MKFTFNSDNGDERFAGKSFACVDGIWDSENGFVPDPILGDTLLIWGDDGWSPVFQPSEFGRLEF